MLIFETPNPTNVNVGAGSITANYVVLLVALFVTATVITGTASTPASPSVSVT